MIEVYCDGASRGQGIKNLGDAAAAVVIHRNKKEIARMARGLGKRTNNEAEYEAVTLGLIICAAAGLSDPIIYSDSTLVVNQILGIQNCRTEILQSYLYTIQDIQESFRFRIQHVPRSKVASADALANDFLDKLPQQIEAKARKRKKQHKVSYRKAILHVIGQDDEKVYFSIPSWDIHQVASLEKGRFPQEFHSATHVEAWINIKATSPEDLKISRFQGTNK